MKNWNWKDLVPHAIAVAIFVVVALVYCKPALEGKVLQQSDIVHWKGMSKDIQNYRDTHNGVSPLWTTTMFGGMPGYQIATNNNNYVSYYANEIFSFFIPKPFRFFILACLGFYFLGCVLRFNPWLNIMGALAFAYSSYDPIIVAVGHDTKMLSIAYMPALLGAMFLVFQKKYWLGGALTALFSSILVYQNHYQVTFYFILMAAFVAVAYLVDCFRNKQVPHWALSMGIIAVAGLAGVLANAVMLFTTYDYAKETIRGGQASLVISDSTHKNAKASAGLDTAYAFRYSYGIPETFTLITPNIYGGASGYLGENSKLVETMSEKGIPQQAMNQLYGEFPSYWGDQPQTSGPVYLGAITCFLFIFGLVYIRGWQKWWMAGISVLAIMMAWGKHLPGFNAFLFDHLPMYNKFRAPTIILIIPQLTFPLLGIMALNKALFTETNPEERWKKFRLSVAITAGLFIVLVMLYFGLDYRNGTERIIQDQLNQAVKNDPTLGRDLVSAVLSDRRSLFGKDLVRSLVLVALSVIVLALYFRNKLKLQVVLGAMILLSSFDVLSVGRRYLNEDNFLEPEDSEGVFNLTPADVEIKKDPDPNYRVLNLTQDIFNDAITSYHHKSIGGYHAAKLSNYQDLIENQIGPAIQRIGNGQTGLSSEPVLNMLNMKYIIVRDPSNGQYRVQQNPGALGSCWLVKHVEFVKGPAEEMKALNHFNPTDTAFVQEQYKNAVPFQPQWDSTASIRLVKNDNDVVDYSFNSNANEFAVFSEVYYSRGWKAFIDGKESPIARVNYVLRGLAIPTGKHQVQFRFEPAAYITGSRVTNFAQIFIVFLIAIGLFMAFRRKK